MSFKSNMAWRSGNQKTCILVPLTNIIVSLSLPSHERFFLTHEADNTLDIDSALRTVNYPSTNRKLQQII